MYKGTFLEYLVDRMDISTVKEHYAEFSEGGDFADYVKELAASRDSQLSAVPSELLEKLEELSKIVPIPPRAITYENGVEIVDFVQDTIMPEYYNWIKRGIAG